MSNEYAEKISESLRIKDVMEFYGVQFNSRGFAKCPFHSEKTASLSIKKEHYKCFGCGAYGGVIDFVMNYFNLKFMQAIMKLDNDFHLGLTGRKPTYRDRLQAAENQRVSEAEKKWKEDIHCEYLTLCEVRSILYGRLINDEEWLQNMVERLDMLLDDFTGEEARAWEMAMRPRESIRKKIF